jgi:phenylacetate-coenzyme A ligase PaaK-like adenylate-forming protein
MDVSGLIHGPIREIAPVTATIVQEGINALVGIPTQVLALLRSKEGSSITRGTLKSVLLSTDYVPVAIEQELARAWGCTVFHHYGMTEMGLGGGVECEALGGYHLREADLYVEIVDPETGKPRREGERGEIVFTTLTRKGMPLIRYRTGDIASFIPEPCPCGTILRRMERVAGRWEGIIRLHSNNTLKLTDLDEALFPLPWLLNYRALLSRDGGNDILEVEVYIVQGLEPKEHQVYEALKKVPAVAQGLEMGRLTIAPLRISDQNWSTTGTAKRILIDSRGRSSF